MSAVGYRVPGQPSLRIAPMLSIAAAVAAVAVMVSNVVAADQLAGGSFRAWVFVASSGFGLSVELCLAGAVLLLFIDLLAGGHYRGQRAAFGLLVAIAAVAVVANVAAAIADLTLSVPGLGIARLIGVKAEVTAGSLAPVVLAGLAAWVGVLGAKSANEEQR